MSKTNRYIGFDIGAESGRCIVGVFENESRELSLHEVSRFNTPVVYTNGHYFWDILRLFGNMEQAIRTSVDEFGSSFDGISVDTWGVDYVLLDPNDRLLGYPYHYRDSRTDPMMEYAATVMPHREIYRNTGIQFMQLNTLFQLLAEQQQTLSLLFIADQFLPIPNYLLYLLSGRRAAEYSSASTTQLCNPWERSWSRSILSQFNFPPNLFPEMVEPGTILGKVSPEIAQNTCLDTDTPIVACATHDTAAAVASVPAKSFNWAYLSSGTWSLMGVETNEPIVTDDSYSHNFTNEGGVAGTTRFLKNIMGLWILQECRKQWKRAGQEFTYRELEKLAGETAPVETWIEVDDARFLKPGKMVDKVIDFLKETNQEYDSSPGWIARCIIESLAFKYRLVFQELEQLTGKKIERLHGIGGGIRNALLCQFTADALDRPFVAGPVEGTAAGNIGVQALATGLLSDIAELRSVIAQSFHLKTYQPSNTEYWDCNLKRYLGIVESAEKQTKR